MLLMIIVGAAMFGYMLTKLLVPQELVALVAEWGWAAPASWSP